MFGLEKTAARIVAGLALAALFAIILTLYSCGQMQTAKTRTKLAEGQAGAAVESGRDAVQTVGNSQGRETQIQETVKDGTDAINKAPAGNSNAAADRAACGMRAYRRQPRCVALLGPAP